MNIGYFAMPGVPRDRNIYANRIVDVILSTFGVSMNQLASKSRKRHICEPRQIGMYLLKKHTTMNLREIANLFGGRDHTTAIHSINTVHNMMKVDADIRKVVKSVEDKL